VINNGHIIMPRDAVTRNRRTPGSIQLWTLNEVASALRVSRRTVQRMTGSGELPVVRIGRRTLIKTSDLRRLIERSSEQGPRS
jgi:excisionase family DNA binding protein